MAPAREIWADDDGSRPFDAPPSAPAGPGGRRIRRRRRAYRELAPGRHTFAVGGRRRGQPRPQPGARHAGAWNGLTQGEGPRAWRRTFAFPTSIISSTRRPETRRDSSRRSLAPAASLRPQRELRRESLPGLDVLGLELAPGVAGPAHDPQLAGHRGNAPSREPALARSLGHDRNRNAVAAGFGSPISRDEARLERVPRRPAARRLTRAWTGSPPAPRRSRPGQGLVDEDPVRPQPWDRGGGPSG